MEPSPGRYVLEGSFTIGPAPAADFALQRGTVWGVLTDYDHLSDFLPSLILSRVRHAEKDHLLLDQVMEGRIFIFALRFSLTLDVLQEPFRRIAFKDILHKSFEAYSGEWIVEDAAGTATVHYHLDVVRGGRTPFFVDEKSLLVNNVRDLLSRVRAEIARRYIRATAAYPAGQ